MSTGARHRRAYGTKAGGYTVKYRVWTPQRITRSGNCGPVLRFRQLWSDGVHSSPPPAHGQRFIPTAGRGAPSFTRYAAHRNGRRRDATLATSPPSAAAMWENALPFGVSRKGALARSKREEAHGGQAVGFTSPDHPRSG